MDSIGSDKDKRVHCEHEDKHRSKRNLLSYAQGTGRQDMDNVNQENLIKFIN